MYPGTVAVSSPDPHDDKFVAVEFDDGDSGRIAIEDIRFLEPNYPVVGEYLLYSFKDYDVYIYKYIFELIDKAGNCTQNIIILKLNYYDMHIILNSNIKKNSFFFY